MSWSKKTNMFQQYLVYPYLAFTERPVSMPLHAMRPNTTHLQEATWYKRYFVLFLPVWEMLPISAFEADVRPYIRSKGVEGLSTFVWESWKDSHGAYNLQRVKNESAVTPPRNHANSYPGPKKWFVSAKGLCRFVLCTDKYFSAKSHYYCRHSQSCAYNVRLSH